MISLFIGVILLVLAFEIWMFIDMLKNPHLTDQNRLLWAIGMLFVHPFVAILYYLTDHKKIF
jgi:hypothetical protein